MLKTIGVFLLCGWICIPFVQAQEIVSPGDDQQFEGFNLRGYTQAGEKSWDVKGATANIVDNQIQLTTVEAKVFGDEQINLTAESGSIDQVSGKMQLRRNVIIASESGSTLKTEALDWERDQDLVSSEEEVLLTDEKISALGTGLEAHPNLKTAVLKKDVILKIKTELKKINGQLVTITCDGPLEVDQLKHQAILSNNVFASQEGREVRADRMEVNFDETANQLKDLTCIGNVTITQGKSTSHAKKAVYTSDSKKLILSGRPKMILMTEGEGKIATPGN